MDTRSGAAIKRLGHFGVVCKLNFFKFSLGMVMHGLSGIYHAESGSLLSSHLGG
ncbi:hypothetical protein MA16_Dca010755 [Dendrobium catenatum]|uniref:Uncharacterized protein n=1 Tax=Dendrobium catenatum TaxID=906689 RepID=A0A2I0VKA0_9ASPA|nr:hypothetical protein MA16_Dca010755 [Dendrobium catenatum]